MLQRTSQVVSNISISNNEDRGRESSEIDSRNSNGSKNGSPNTNNGVGAQHGQPKQNVPSPKQKRKHIPSQGSSGSIRYVNSENMDKYAYNAVAPVEDTTVSDEYEYDNIEYENGGDISEGAYF